ncbi:hypothetical protein [Enterobacter roggenkampii]
MRRKAHYPVDDLSPAPELNIELAARRKDEKGEPWQALYTVTGYNL